jgi:hypothetical protein
MAPRNRWLRLLEFDVVEGEAPTLDLPDLASLDNGALNDLLSELTDRFDEVREGDLDPESVNSLTALRDNIVAVRAEQDRRATEAAERAETVAALTAEVHPLDVEEETPEEETPEEETEAPSPNPEPADQPEARRIAASSTPVTRVPIGAVSARAPRPSRTPTAPDELGVVVTAAADIPGLSTGSRIRTWDRVGLAVHERARMLANDGRRVPVCRIEKPIPEMDTITAATSPSTAVEIIDRVRAVPAGGIDALVASGGFCGPLTPLYNVCRIDAADGMIGLPTIRVTRAGVSVPSPITIPADLTTITWTWTNQNDKDAGPGSPAAPNPTKPCITIPCPTWTDYTLTAYGICVTAGNLMDRSFPELIRDYISMVGNAHLHAVNAMQIAAIEAGSTAVAGPAVGSATSSIEGAADLAAEFYREKYHMSTNATLDIILPAWVRTVVRSDLAARAGVDLLSISDAQVTAQFTARNLRPVFVQDWQPLANATAFPASVKMLIYPPGTWVVGDGGTLDLGVVRDSTLNSTNDYTAAWSEDFQFVAKVCTESLVVTSTISVNGVTACCP